MKTSGYSRRAAFSLTEIVVTIGVLGVLSAIALPMFTNVRESSHRTVAQDHVEALNRALNSFSQGCWKITTPAVSGDSADEFAVLRSLQWRFPASQLKLGSPFFDPKYDPAASSSTLYYRIQWNGRSFELLDKGQAGTGLKFDQGGDIRPTPYSFPSGYKPEGAL